MRASYLIFLLMSSFKLSNYGLFAQERVQLGAHVHGSGEMTVVLEKDSLHIELKLPAHDILGFESRPRTHLQRQRLERQVRNLRRAQRHFQFSEAAKCSLQNAQARMHSIELPKDEDHRRLEEEHGHAHPAGEHSDMLASYRFKCSEASKLSGITLNIFDHYKSIRSIRAQAVFGDRQTSQNLTPENRELKRPRGNR